VFFSTDIDIKEGNEMRKKMKHLKRTWGIFFLVLFICAGEVFADKIILENGDKLTGKVESVIDGKLTIVTDYAGPIVIPVSKIKEIDIDNPVEVHLKDGEVLKGKVKTAEDKKLTVESSPEREETTVSMKNVESINPPPVKWRGNIAVGGNLQSGNTDRAGASVALQLARKTEKDRISFRYLFNYGEEDSKVTTRNHYGEAKYDYFFTPKFYAYLAGDLFNDKFSDTRFRTFVGPGAGYQFWDDPIKSLLFEAGLTYFYWGRYEGKDTDGLSARLGLDFRYQIFKWLAFNDRFQFYPTIGEGGLYFLRNESALTAPLGAGFSLRLANIVDYNSKPEPGFRKTDVQWIGAIQYSF
jgi:putative salt-induced outer membrane protein YdiY